MSSLPPYSTFRTDAKQMMYPQQLSHGNVLTFTPPGFNQILNVKFPDCRLAVCEKCKKNYKTRDMCRVRNAHTTEPWTTAFICFTLDDNCTDENGKYVDKPFAVRMIQWQPYCAKTPFDPKTPVCSACKKTNRTRSFCRDRHKHRQLPWCTVYVLLSPADSIDPATCVAPESTPIEVASESTPTEQADVKLTALEPEGDKEVTPIKSESDPNVKEETCDAENDTENGTEGEAKEETVVNGTTETDVKEVPEVKEEVVEDEVKEERPPIRASSDGENINDIAESRTFLAKVSCHATSIHWLELSDFDSTDQHAAMQGLVAPDGGHGAIMGRHPGMPPGPPMDPAYAPHFAQAMGYAAQHQQSLKNHQQYFYQLQQRQHQQYAAQQAQWHSQYNQQSQMQMGMPPGPPPPGGAVTAGEAAAQQAKHQGPPPQEQMAQYGQWPGQHNAMAYHHQMYQNQMAQFQQTGGVIPPGVLVNHADGAPPQMHPPPAEHHYQQQMHPGNGGDDLEASSVHNMMEGEGDDGNDRKRVRHV